jgi:hypothetical protein
MRHAEQSNDLARTSWHQFLETVTKEHQGDDVTLELVEADFGDEFEAEKLPLFAMEYDHRDDAVIVSVGARDRRYPVVLRHIIRQPRRIMVDPLPPRGAMALEVVAADDSTTVIVIHPRD